MKTTTLVLAAALAFLAAPALRAMDDWERHVKIQPDTLIRGVTVPTAFKGSDGKSHPAGAYEISVRNSPQGILIGLLRDGKQVAEMKGRFFAGIVNRFSTGESRVGDPPGGATQGHDASDRKASPAGTEAHMGDGSVRFLKQNIDSSVHFDPSSEVSFAGGAGKISCNNRHPGEVNPCWISFDLPAVQVNPGPPERK